MFDFVLSQLAPSGFAVGAGEGNSLSNSPRDKAIVFGVNSDPEPKNPAVDINPECAMVKADAARPESPHSLQI
jgi:hypothetical protein